MEASGYSCASRHAEAVLAMHWQVERFPLVATTFGDGGSDFMPAIAAWEPDTHFVDSLLEYQGRFAAGMDERTRGAHLISFYSHHLAIAAGAIYLLTGLVPALDPGRLAISFKPCAPTDASGPARGTAADMRRLHFGFRAFAEAPADVSLFHDAFVSTLAPAIDAVRIRTGLSAAAQWRLVADGIAGAFLEIGSAIGDEERAMASALAVVNMAGSPLACDVAHYCRIAAVVGGVPVERTFRLRGGCCLYYRTEGGGFCDVCVLLDQQTQKSRLRAHLERAGD